MSNTSDFQAKIEINKNTEELEYVGFWIRFWAYITDVLVLFSVNGILLSPLKFINEGVPIDVSYWTLKGIIAAVIYYAYFLLMTKYFKQTVGKMVFGIKVVKHTFTDLRWGDVIFREVIGRFIYNVFGFMKLLYLVAAFTNEKQGLHDMLGNTRVIKVKE